MGADKKAMLGHKVRRLRRDHNLTQAQMAEQLGISASYLNLIEHNQRPVTVQLLLKLGQAFEIDLQAFAEDEESRLIAGLREVFADPLFAGSDVKNSDFRELAAVAPTLGQAVVTLYQAYRESREDIEALAGRVADRDKLQVVQAAAFPVEEVRDFFHAQGNHFPELESAAEELWRDLKAESGDLYRGLTDFLSRAHGVRVKLMPMDVMGTGLRRFDRHSRRILLSEMLPPSGRNFQLACQIALLHHRDLLDRLAAGTSLSGDEARRLTRIGLSNYFAGAVLMPYDRFIEAARSVRYDIEILGHRFDASFEQVCHRLTTLQRPGAKGVPFFLIRVDNAGNVSKRFSAGSLNFARFGGACPRWNVHDAFRSPGQIMTQLARMPDGTTYFSIARTVDKSGGGWRSPPQQFAIGLGCDVAHAGQLVYAEGVDLDNVGAATPIGVNCRLCPRLDCSQRAFPPLNHRLIIDENQRGLSTYFFMPGRQQTEL
ncbi:helix-turn-helix domain-containing protein [Skermanella sp. TT6]|nr:short-chain fatty acyl-CoA regulator family protein [Skermanella sp. TT6]